MISALAKAAQVLQDEKYLKPHKIQHSLLKRIFMRKEGWGEGFEKVRPSSLPVSMIMLT
ncbi:MAG: hypothetical protein Ct9H300mP23_10000 [Nitrospinota bacterium]|nr:MAG: hypothetical protein Ct9H300mP23_10000 [Nitrospinota bacterium]